jgi:hypothetical protein
LLRTPAPRYEYQHMIKIDLARRWLKGGMDPLGSRGQRLFISSKATWYGGTCIHVHGSHRPSAGRLESPSIPMYVSSLRPFYGFIQGRLDEYVAFASRSLPFVRTILVNVSVCKRRGRAHPAYYWRVADEDLPVWQQYRGTNK